MNQKKTGNGLEKALIVYGTRWGGTVKVADRIGETLKSNGYSVDIVNAKDNPPSPEPYNLVVIGSGISANKWTKESIEYLKKYSSRLREKKSAFFISCGAVEKEKQEDRESDYQVMLPDIVSRYGLNPVMFGFFGGVIDFKSDFNLLDRIIVWSSKNKLRKLGIDTSKPYDFRNWKEIENWAINLSRATLPIRLSAD